MLIVILSILSLLSILFFISNRLPYMLLCLTMINSGLFGFMENLGETSVKPQDFLIVTTYIILFIAYIRYKDFLSIKKDSLGKSVLWCFLWTFIVFIGTIYYDIDTPIFAFKAYRSYLILPFFFVLRKMTMNDFRRYLKLVMYLSIIQGVFYYLQLTGVTGVLSGYGSELELGEALEEHRFGNYPSMAVFFFLYHLFAEGISLPKRIIHVIFWGMMPIIGQMRGAIIALGASIALFAVLRRNFKSLIVTICIAIASLYVVFPMFQLRERKGMSTLQEIEMVISNPRAIYANYNSKKSSGTFVFRIAMLSERVEFLMDNPELLLTGVGTIHEDSPNQKFNFDIGTATILEDGSSKIGMLSSADITWVGIIMKFGLIGIFLFSLIYFNWIRLGLPNIKSSKNLIFSIFAVTSVGEYISSFNYESLGRTDNLMAILIAIAVVSIYTKGLPQTEPKSFNQPHP